MHTITKRYYVSYKDGIISCYGCSDGLFIQCGADYAEFDTEAEMLQYIKDNELVEESNEAE